jgi:hypothetical protein
MKDELLTTCLQSDKVPDMDTTTETVAEEAVQEAGVKQRPAARMYRDLPAKPIMVYPQSDEQRKEFEQFAALENRKLSPFIVHVVSEYIRLKKLTDTPEGRLEEARRRIAQRTA